MDIYIVGPQGAGKTTFIRKLEEHLKVLGVERVYTIQSEVELDVTFSDEPITLEWMDGKFI